MTLVTSPTPQPSSDPDSAPTADEQLLAAVLARGESTAGTGNSSGVLLVTTALFVGLGGLQWGWETVAFLSIAIAIHELGHVMAMRIFGYKNVRMLFIPLFGGLATGEPQELDATRNALVALAGPVVGLASVLIVCVAAFFLGSPPWLVEFAWVSLFINAVNLLPCVPLDGGQVVNNALFSRLPVAELIFRLLAVVGLAALAYVLKSWILALLPILTLMGTSLAYRRARLVSEARRDPVWQTRPLDVATAAALRGLVRQIFVSVRPESYVEKLPDHVQSVWLEINKRFPSRGRAAALLGAYLVILVMGVPGLAILLTVFFPSPDFAE